MEAVKVDEPTRAGVDARCLARPGREGIDDMAKYRKKPMVVEAEQYLTEFGPVEGMLWDSTAEAYLIETPEGPLWVIDSDWIITGVKGKKCPVKNDIFRETYEPVKKRIV